MCWKEPKPLAAHDLQGPGQPIWCCSPGSDQELENCVLPSLCVISRCLLSEAWEWGGGHEPVVTLGAKLVTVNTERSRLLSLLMLLKTRFMAVSEPFPRLCCVHTCLSWNWVWISLHTWSNCDNILMFSTSSCKLGFHPQRSTPSILKAPVLLCLFVFSQKTPWLTLQAEGDRTIIWCLKISVQYYNVGFLLRVPFLGSNQLNLCQGGSAWHLELPRWHSQWVAQFSAFGQQEAMGAEGNGKWTMCLSIWQLLQDWDFISIEKWHLTQEEAMKVPLF